MSLASDGERAFVIRGAAISPDEAALAIQIGGVTGGMSASTNQLAAFELATEGKLVWELDGVRTATAPWPARFSWGRRLRSITRCTCWRKSAAPCTWWLSIRGPGGWNGSNSSWAWSKASPSIRVAGWRGARPPTAAGFSFAQRRPARRWRSTWSVASWLGCMSTRATLLTAVELRNLLQQQIQNQMVRGNDHWLDSAAIIDDGRVYLSPPESQELHCVDLRSGSVLWKHRQGDALFVGCVDKGNVVLVGSGAVEAIRAVDGGAAWPEKSLALPEGTRPAGQGYVSEGRYYLPLTSGAVLAIDVATGKQISLAVNENGSILGNLICVRGSVVSQSPLVLDKFEQIDVLERRADAALAKNADDATAIRELAEIKRLAGRLPEAIVLLKRAFDLSPQDPLVREMLMEYLLAAMAEDYNSNRGDVPLLRRLVAGQPQEIQLLRLEARGLEEAGERLAAWDAYMRVGDLEADKVSQLTVAADHLVRSDRWLAGRLAALWKGGSAGEQSDMKARINAQVQTLGRQRGVEFFRHYLSRFGGLSVGDSARLQLGRLLIEAGQFPAAELELLQVTHSEAAESRAAAAVLLTKAQLESGRIAAAAVYARQLLDDWSDVPALDGETGRQWVERFTKDSSALADELAAKWPRGRVTARNTAASGPTIRPPGPGRGERQLGSRQLRIEQVYGAALETDDWSITTENPQLIGRKQNGDDLATFRAWNRTAAAGHFATAARFTRPGWDICCMCRSAAGSWRLIRGKTRPTAKASFFGRPFRSGNFRSLRGRADGAARRGGRPFMSRSPIANATTTQTRPAPWDRRPRAASCSSIRMN